MWMSLALAVAPSPAHALDCAWGVHASNVSPDAVVPANARILVNHTFDDPDRIVVDLQDADGTSVPVVLEEGHRHAYVVPEAPLAEGAAYTLSFDGVGEPVPFSIGAADDDPPGSPVLVDLVRVRDRSAWGLVAGMRVEVDPVAGAAHYEFEVSTDPEFVDSALVASPWPEAFLGDGLCDRNVEGYDHSVRSYVRARAVDLAGNTSAWTDPELAVGCATAGPGSWGWIGLGLLALARRRTGC